MSSILFLGSRITSIIPNISTFTKNKGSLLSSILSMIPLTPLTKASGL
jgi:hypothetical protein